MSNSDLYLTSMELDQLQDLILQMAQDAMNAGKIPESHGLLDAQSTITQARKICHENRQKARFKDPTLN
jgi:hypothetical protein